MKRLVEHNVTQAICYDIEKNDDTFETMFRKQRVRN